MTHCKVCQDPVYTAEEIKAIGVSFHRACFACQECKKKLTLGEENPREGLPYCKLCYAKKWGFQGTTMTGGNLAEEPKHASIDMRTFKEGFVDPLKQKPSPSENRSGVAPIAVQSGTKAANEAQLNRHALQEAENDDEDDDLFNARKAVESVRFAEVVVPSVQKSKFDKGKNAKGLGGGEKCKKCEKSVGPAEKVVFGGAVWHKTTCLSCYKCGKGMNSAAEACEAKTAEGTQAACKPCYQKWHGPNAAKVASAAAASG